MDSFRPFDLYNLSLLGLVWLGDRDESRGKSVRGRTFSTMLGTLQQMGLITEKFRLSSQKNDTLHAFIRSSLTVFPFGTLTEEVVSTLQTTAHFLALRLPRASSNLNSERILGSSNGYGYLISERGRRYALKIEARYTTLATKESFTDAHDSRKKDIEMFMKKTSGRRLQWQPTHLIDLEEETN